MSRMKVLAYYDRHAASDAVCSQIALAETFDSRINCSLVVASVSSSPWHLPAVSASSKTETYDHKADYSCNVPCSRAMPEPGPNGDFIRRHCGISSCPTGARH